MIGTICRRRDREHHLRAFYLRQRPVLVAEEHAAIFQLPAVFVRNGEDFPVELLDDQRDHEKDRHLFRHDDKQRRLLPAELLRVDLRIEAENLFQLAVEEGIGP